jgi:hypothetical protein
VQEVPGSNPGSPTNYPLLVSNTWLREKGFTQPNAAMPHFARGFPRKNRVSCWPRGVRSEYSPQSRSRAGIYESQIFTHVVSANGVFTRSIQPIGTCSGSGHVAREEVNPNPSSGLKAMSSND